jgi:hypothetical protein
VRNINSRTAAATRFGVGLLGVVFITGFGAEQSKNPQALPRIRIAQDHRTFETEQGKPFVPLGVNYYRPGTGWAPQVWKQFDAEATRRDFAKMKEFGINCVRVFVTYGSFYRDAGRLEPEGLTKFDEFLALAEAAGIYVHPTGPDHWEGMPNWSPVSIEDERTLSALGSFWKQFAARYAGRNVIFAYDLKNEPEVGWTSPGLREQWNGWLRAKYPRNEMLTAAWGATNELALGNLPIPSDKGRLKNRELLDYHSFREHLADEWTRRQAEAIKSADPNALVTVGMIQWSVPYTLPAGPRHYAAFRPERQAKFLDFLEIHFYPLAQGAYEYRSEAEETANLAYVEAIVREVARAGKPVVIAEFGWYGGGKPKFDGGTHPAATEEQHARYCRRVVETTAGLAVGWINWGFYDQPEASDCSEMTGLLTAVGKTKAWGSTFKGLASRFTGKRIPALTLGHRPDLDWDACLTSMEAQATFRKHYLEAFEAYQKSRRTPSTEPTDPTTHQAH